MADKTWLDWSSELAMFLPDCPVFTIADALKRQSRMFYTHTRAWRVDDVDLGLTVAGEQLYQVHLPDDLEMLAITQAWVGGEEVDELVGSSPAGLTSEGTFEMRIAVVASDQFRLAPAPLVTGEQIMGTVAYVPASAVDGLPTWQWEQHREAIEHYVLSYLRSQAGKPWADPNDAIAHRQEAAIHALRLSTESGPRNRPNARLRVVPA